MAATAAMFIVGAGMFGTVIAWRNVLLHARSGGILLAVAIPFSLVTQNVVVSAGFDIPLLQELVIAVPFSLAWLLLGLDLLTVDSGGVDVTIIREPD
jgi:hypothetical protein